MNHRCAESASLLTETNKHTHTHGKATKQAEGAYKVVKTGNTICDNTVFV